METRHKFEGVALFSRAGYELKLFTVKAKGEINTFVGRVTKEEHFHFPINIVRDIC